MLRWFRGHRNIFQKWKSTESKQTFIDARIWRTVHVFPCSFFYNLPIVPRFGTQTAAPRSVRAVPIEVTAWPALTTGMGRLGLTARRSHTPVMKGWALTRQAPLQRLRAIVGKNAMGGKGNIVPIVSVLGWTQPGAGTEILTGGTKVDSCLGAQSVRDTKQAIVMTSFSCLQSRLTPHSDECLCLVQRHRTCPRGNSDYSVLRRLPLSRNSGCDQHPRANPAHNHSTSHSFVL